METKLAHVKLAHIVVSESNKMFRDQDELSEGALKELIDSVKEQGVIQPIMLRPLPKVTSEPRYELVCGERRFMASTYAQLGTIPANIRELTDEEAFQLQVTENLQRKDVHPLKEAHAYKYLVDKDPKTNTAAELALRFGKTEHYIHTRLKLNDLIAEAKKDFSDGLMSIGHALLIARLTPEDQKKTIDRCTDSYMQDKQRVRIYQTVHDLEEDINDSVICNLNTAAFKKDDATLLPKAGACLTCPKRSGASQLFADVSDKDRCFDPKCFMAKRMKFMATQIPHLIETKPDIVFLETSRGNSKVDADIAKVIKDNKVKVLKSGSDYETHDWTNKKPKIKGIYINGDEVGKNAIVFSTKEKAAAAGVKVEPEKVNAKEAIARINERLERGVELDQEKIYTGVVELLQTNKAVDAMEGMLTSAEVGLLTHLIYDKADYAARQIIDKKLGLGKLKKEAEISVLFKQIGNSPAKLAWMVRTIAIRQYGSAFNHDKSDGILITEMARTFNIPVDDLIKTQNDIRIKREENAAKRKRELQPEKKAAVKKPAKKVAAKTKSKVDKGLSVLLQK